MADASWGISRYYEAQSAEFGKSKGNLPKESSTSEQISKNTDKSMDILIDESLVLTKQMASLYRPDKESRVLEFHYTDIDKTYQILLSPNGADVITENFDSYTTKIETSYELWRAISLGEISGQDAFFQGKYKVLGDLSLMLEWDKLFGIESPEDDAKKLKESGYNDINNYNIKNSKKPNIILLLLPWITLWVLLPMKINVDGINLSGIMGISVAAIIPLFWISFKSVIYEQLSIPIITLLSLMALLEKSPKIIISFSYLIFEVIWLISSKTSIPLTTYYIADSFGGESAFSNQIFMKTNHIITAAWGFVFLGISILSYLIMGTVFSSYTVLVSGVLLAVMGIFTVWFQKWYPRKLINDMK